MNKIFEDLHTRNKQYVNNISTFKNDSEQKLHLACNKYVKNEQTINKMKSLYIKLSQLYNWFINPNSSGKGNQLQCRICENEFPLSFLMRCQTCNLQNLSRNFYICLNCIAQKKFHHKHYLGRVTEAKMDSVISSSVMTGTDFCSKVKGDTLISIQANPEEKEIKRNITFKNTGKTAWKTNKIQLQTNKQTEIPGFTVLLQNEVEPGKEVTFTVTIKLTIAGANNTEENYPCGYFYSVWQLYNQGTKKYFGDEVTFQVKAN